MVLPSAANGTKLSARELQDALSMRHEQTPRNFPSECDGCCDTHFSIQSALARKKGGLLIFRRNEIRDEVVNLASKALTPSAAHNKPLIHGRANENAKTSPTTSTSQSVDKEVATGEDERGDSSIRGFWEASADCILDVCVADMDSESNCKQTHSKC